MIGKNFYNQLSLIFVPKRPYLFVILKQYLLQLSHIPTELLFYGLNVATSYAPIKMSNFDIITQSAAVTMHINYAGI